MVRAARIWVAVWSAVCWTALRLVAQKASACWRAWVQCAVGLVEPVAHCGGAPVGLLGGVGEDLVEVGGDAVGGGAHVAGGGLDCAASGFGVGEDLVELVEPGGGFGVDSLAGCDGAVGLVEPVAQCGGALVGLLGGVGEDLVEVGGDAVGGGADVAGGGLALRRVGFRRR